MSPYVTTTYESICNHNYLWYKILQIRINKVIIFIIFIVFWAFPLICTQSVDYININDPFLRKIPIAVPYFKSIDEGSFSTQVSKNASKKLYDALDFTGYFKLIDHKAFIDDPTKRGMVAKEINFSNWTGIGAELLIIGGVKVNGDKVVMELKLFDTLKERMLVGKKYKGSIEDLRKIIHRFCGEVMFQLIGNRGIFGSKIAFVLANSGLKEIYICDFDGRDLKQFTNYNSISITPAWSSDGKWLAFTTFKEGKPDIFIKHLEKNRWAQIAKKGINISPAWVPGQFKLSASLSFSGDSEIYLLTGMGKIIKKLTIRRGIDVSPSWSPDGKKFAFVSRRSGSPQIYICNYQSGKIERLTYNGNYNQEPSWSPKGDKIAFTGMKEEKLDIYVIGIDGNELTQLTCDSGDNESPSWSPDGSLIVFSSTREGSSKICMMTAYGKNQRRLFYLPGEQSNPQWSPAVFR